MAKTKTVYVCSECGHRQNVRAGQCPVCKSRASFEEEEEEVGKSSSPSKRSGKKTARALRDVKIDKSLRIKSDIGEFDRVLGGGLVRDSLSILTARPGAGKSTLLLELAQAYGKKGFKVLYTSGEESEGQIKDRAGRILGKEINPNIRILSTNSLDDCLDQVQKIDPDIVFVDSISTMTLDRLDNKPGSPTQTVECTEELMNLAKNPSRPRAIIMVGHMTKAGEMAGLRTLEHMVDTVMFLDDDSEENLRLLSCGKNRFGRTGEVGLFSMEEEGLVEIKNPSEYFITERESDVEGSAIGVMKEGNRLIEVEIESLVSQSFLPYPQRIGDSLRKDQLSTLISILQERAGLNLFDKDVIIKATGGIRLKETSVNLAIMVSIASSFLKKPVDKKSVFMAEVGLTGDLKKVSGAKDRVRDLERLGYEKVYLAKNSLDGEKFSKIQVMEFANIGGCIDSLFGR